jgi:hypothetical protein
MWVAMEIKGAGPLKQPVEMRDAFTHPLYVDTDIAFPAILE